MGLKNGLCDSTDKQFVHLFTQLINRKYLMLTGMREKCLGGERGIIQVNNSHSLF